MSDVKRLYKSKDKKISGVCAGIAEYFSLDPTLIRVLYVLATIFSGFFLGVVAYIVLALIMPEEGSKEK